MRRTERRPTVARNHHDTWRCTCHFSIACRNDWKQWFLTSSSWTVKNQFCSTSWGHILGLTGTWTERLPTQTVRTSHVESSLWWCWWSQQCHGNSVARVPAVGWKSMLVNMWLAPRSCHALKSSCSQLDQKGVWAWCEMLQTKGEGKKRKETKKRRKKQKKKHVLFGTNSCLD